MVSRRARRPGGLWLRWAWRDFRDRWVAILAIALVVAIGIGVYAGLGSTSSWRRESNDASFSQLAMHDLRVALSPGTFTSEGALRDAAGGIGASASIAAVGERLVIDSQVDATTARESILVASRIVGMDLGPAGAVDTVWVRDGELPAVDSDAAILEVKFADHWDLAPTGSVTVAGGSTLQYTGLGAIPEDLFYEGPEGTVLAQGELAPLYVSVRTAQELAGRPGQVNDLVLTMADGADRGLVAEQLAAAVDGLGVSATVSTREDADAVRVLYEDIDNDQRFWNAVAGLVLVAAALAAFNLVSRIVEAQRREIGIGMALGVPRRKLAVRPMLVGAQVAVLGAVAGIAVGLLIGEAMGNLLESFLPLPVHVTTFQVGVYAQAAALGVGIPLLAAAIPVWRAVRVEPIEAIRAGHLAAKSSRMTDWTARLRLPGSSLTEMPIRNLLRTPRRTLLTAAGVGAAITALIAVLGMLDSFGRTVDTIDAELTQKDPDRVLVSLDTFHATDSAVVGSVRGSEAVGAAESGLRLPATAIAGDAAQPLDLLLELVDIDGGRWRPTIDHRLASATSSQGVVLAQKAADDLGVVLGDPVTLRHPLQVRQGFFTLATSELVVVGIHANPMRAFAFMDIAQAHMFGLEGAVNIMSAYPADGSTRTELQRALFQLPGVASTQSVARLGESFDEALNQFVSILVIAALAVLVLALLISFNATRITIEERQREHATMRAFGLPVRAIMGVVVKESVLVGIVATVIGTVAGSLFLGWMLDSVMSTTIPDLQVDRYVSPVTVLVAMGVGILAVALAPLLLVKRIRSMSIPDTLRTME